jgi:hypothetical protein
MARKEREAKDEHGALHGKTISIEQSRGRFVADFVLPARKSKIVLTVERYSP